MESRVPGAVLGLLARHWTEPSPVHVIRHPRHLYGLAHRETDLGFFKMEPCLSYFLMTLEGCIFLLSFLSSSFPSFDKSVLTPTKQSLVERETKARSRPVRVSQSTGMVGRVKGGRPINRKSKKEKRTPNTKRKIWKCF